jgi:Tol biopolymer transport system component
LQAIPLTTYIGDETSPTFSPDDSAVAFAWNGQAQDNYDIYTLRIGDPGPRRLTDDPSPEYSPVWSPNGRSIAFIRARSGQIPEVILLDPISGAQRKLAEARIVVNPQHHRLDWSVDSRWVVISEWTPSGGSDRIYAINVDDGQQFALTSPPKASFDGSPAISPDGKFLAFIRDASQFSSSLMVIPLGPGMKPIGTERRIDLPEFGKATSLNYPAWSSSSEVVLNVWNGQQNRRLYQVSTSSHRAPVLLGELGDQIGLHAISRSGRKLVYSRGVFDTNIWQYELTAQGGTMGNRLLIGSSRFDQQPAISPDGTRIAFETTRSGFSEVWVSLRDGSNAVPLTHFQAFAGSPRWSPDGTFIVFDGSRDDRTDADIYVVPSNGGEPRRVTKDPAADFMPSWATDGQSIYFCSTRTGHEEIWNIPVSGGEAKRITTHGGFESVPSPDGQWLYYSRTNTPVSSIWRIPAKGGEAVKIVDDVRSRTFDITTKGLYFLKGSPSSPTELRLFDVKTLQSETIAHFDRFMRDRLSVSRDDSRLLYTRVDQQTDDLMLVEHLR